MIPAFVLAAAVFAAPLPKDSAADVLFRELGLPAPAGPVVIPLEYAADEIDAAAVRKNPKKHAFRAAVLRAGELLADARAAKFETDIKPIRAKHPLGNDWDAERGGFICGLAWEKGQTESVGQITDGSTVRVNRLQAIREKTALQQLDLKEAARLLKSVEPLREGETSRRWLAHYDLLTGEVGYRLVKTNAFSREIGNPSVPDNDDPKTVWKLVPTEEFRRATAGGYRETYETATALLGLVQDEYPRTPWAKLSAQLLEKGPGFAWRVMPEQ